MCASVYSTRHTMSSLTLLSSFTKTQENLNFVEMAQMLERGEKKYFKVAITKLLQIVGNLNREKKDKQNKHRFEDRKLPWPLWRSAQQSLAEKQCRGERQLSHAQHRESRWQTARPSTIDVMAVHQCPENRNV